MAGSEGEKPGRHLFLLGCILFVLLLLGLSLIKIVGKGNSEAPAIGSSGQKASPVSLVRPQEHRFSDVIEVLGVAKARQGITLTSNTTEMISRILFKDGAFVSRGQVLIELQARQETAALSQVAASLGLSRLNYKRWKDLADQGVAPKAKAEEALAALQVQEAQYRQASAMQQDRVIRAPFSGVIGLTDMAPGALITPGTAIATLDDTSVVKVDLQVPDRYLPRLHEGMQVSGTTEALGGRVWTGRISKLDTRIQDATRAIVARAEFANPDRALRPGMMLKVKLDGGSRTALSLPGTAVQVEGDQAFVFALVRSEGKPGQGSLGHPRSTVIRREVTLGVNQDGQVEIRDGIKASDLVVKDGLSRLQDGMAVKPVGKSGSENEEGTSPRTGDRKTSSGSASHS